MTDLKADNLLMRPTLIIGMGGTGDQIVTRVKARFLETYPPELLGLVRWLVFDTDPNHTPVKNSVGQDVYLEAGSQLIDIGGIDIAAIQDNIGYYSEILAELPGVKNLPRRVIQQGAGQVRAIGRLCFLYHFERIRQAVYNALDGVLNVASHLDNPGTRSAINVFIISSTCGGTGSGFILDMAYLIRYLAKQRGIKPDSIFNYGLMVLPEAFYNQVPYSNRNRIRANTSAMLTELDHFTQMGGFKAEYQGGHRLVDNAPPFHICYLIDATNEKNKTANSMTQLGPVVAEAVFLQAGSFVGKQMSSSFDNVPGAVSLDPYGFLRSYSIVGTASLRFNANRMRQACVYRLVNDLVDQVFLQKPDLKARSEIFHEENKKAERFLSGVRQNVSQYLATLDLAPDLLLSELKRQNDGRVMKIELGIVNFASRPLNRIVVLTQSAVDATESRVNDYLELARQKRTGKAQDIQDEKPGWDRRAKDLLNEFVYRICDDMDLGVYGALRFLQELEQELIKINQSLEEIRQTAQAKTSKLNKRIEKEEERLSLSLNKFNFFGMYRGHLRYALAHYDAFQKRRINYIFTQGLCGEAIALLATIESRRQQLVGILQSMESAFAEAGNTARRELNALKMSWQSSYVTEINYDKPEDIDEFYLNRVNDLTQEARQLIGEDSERAPSRWLQKFEEPRVQTVRLTDEMKHWLSDYAEQKFATLLKEVTLEGLIKNRYADTRSQLQELKRVRALAVPFANHDLSSTGQSEDTLSTISIVGVYDSANSIYRDNKIGNDTLVSTFDPHRISAFQMRSGLSVYSLQQYEMYRQHFFDYVAENRAAHLLNDSEPISLICYEVVETQIEIQRLFALAHALEFFQTQGAIGYVFNLGQEQEKLGVDLPAAMRHFAVSQELQSEVKQLKDQKYQETTMPELVVQYERYLNQPEMSGTSRSLHKDLRLYVRSERDRLRKHL